MGSSWRYESANESSTGGVWNNEKCAAKNVETLRPAQTYLPMGGVGLVQRACLPNFDKEKISDRANA